MLERFRALLLTATSLACGADEPTPMVLAVDTVPELPPPASPRGFRPPPPIVRERAIGPRDQLAPAMRRSFDESVGYVPIAPPGPEDWLASHPEAGQSFEQFLRSGANVPNERRSAIYLLPVGAFAQELVVGDDGVVLVPSPPLSRLTAFARAYFQMPVHVLPGLEVEDLQVGSREHFGRRQLLTTDLLRALAQRLPADAYCLIAVTMEDLYPAESWNFVFGYASLHERVGVYSFARYDPAFYGEPRTAGTRKLILRRGLKVMAHELGHMYGMEHCVFYDCIMNGSNHLDESDAKPLHLCPVCLRKLQHAVGFDPAQRYRALAELYRDAEFSGDVAWIERRLAYIEGD